jgi:hypothetical protein
MNFPEEQHRIDVTTEEKHYKDRPPAIQPRKKPRRPKRELRLPAFTPWDGFARVRAAWERAGQAASRAVRWAMRRPLTYVLLVGIVGALVYVHTRPLTIDGPALAMTGWQVTSSSPGAQTVLEPKLDMPWSAGYEQAEWIALDMRKPQTFHQVVLDCRNEPDQYPRDYAVYVSGDKKHWGKALATGTGTGPVTVIDLPRTTSRYLKVLNVATGKDGDTQWSVDSLTVH